DAYVLGFCLAEGSSVEQALRRYHAIRHGKATRIVRLSWQYGKMSSLKNRWAVAMRDWLMPRVPKELGNRQLRRIYALDY
ncbi:MAG: hypothetical protein V4710_09815, partial [Verrucomicrobiota bacterium]